MKERFDGEAMPEVVQTRAVSHPCFANADLPRKGAKDFAKTLLLQPFAMATYKEIRHGASSQELVTVPDVIPQHPPRGRV
jgi:hypothetical protein